MLQQQVCRTGNPGDSLHEDYVRAALGREGEGFRTDSKTVLAYKLMGHNNLQYRVVAVASFGKSSVSDYENNTIHFTGQNAAVLNTGLAEGSLVEIDLVCAKPPGANGLMYAPRGAGTLLTAYCLCKAAQMRSHGLYKYQGVISNTLSDTMNRILLRLGCNERVVDKVDVQGFQLDNNPNLGQFNEFRYAVSYGAGWVQRVADGLPQVPLLCTLPGTTKCR